MNQSARDLEFEKWLNYLINVVTSVFQIDPSEINFPNRGGATGNSGNTLNEGSAEERYRNSKDKGLEPLLKFIQDTINKYIIAQFSDKYVFVFVGGDKQSEAEVVEMLEKQAKIGLTINDVRERLGEPKIEGGDVILSGVHVQRLGQIIQQQQLEEDKRQGMREFIAQQTGYNGDMDDVNGKETFNQQVGKDGQLKDEDNANSHKTSVKDSSAKDWEM